MRDIVTELIEHRYDLGTPTDVYEIPGGLTNRSFAVVVNKGGRINRYVVRKYKQGTAPDQVRFEHALIKHAIASGLTTSADTVGNDQGQTFVQNDATGAIFAVFTYLAGEDRYTWDNPSLTDAEFQNASRALADFHHAVRDFTPGEKQRKEPPIAVLWPQMADKLTRLAMQNRGGTFHGRYAGDLNRILDAVARTRLDPDAIEDLPVIAVHCDFHPGNLKWDRDQVVGIFDLDWSKMDLRLFDLAMACVYFCSSWRADTSGELRLAKFSLFLRSYHRRLSRLRGLEALKRAEQRLLPDMLTAATVYLIHWIAADYFSKEDADEQQYQSYLTHGIRLLRWLETHRPEIASRIASAQPS